MSARLHHTGFVVPSIAPAVEAFTSSMGHEWDSTVIHDRLEHVPVKSLLLPQGAGRGSSFVDPDGDELLEERWGMCICYDEDDLDAELGLPARKKYCWFGVPSGIYGTPRQLGTKHLRVCS